MANLTLSIPKDIHDEMQKHPEIKWSEVARQAIAKKIRDLKALDKILKKSTLKPEDVDELDHVIKLAAWKKHEKALKRAKKDS